jgi:ferredoxin
MRSTKDKSYWKIDHDNCYERWRSLGTDCGICLSTCPFSHGIEFPDGGSFEDRPEAIREALAVSQEKYGMRRYIREPLELMK